MSMVIKWLNESLENKYPLTEANNDKERFVAFAGQDLADRFNKLKDGHRIKNDKDNKKYYSDYEYWEKRPVEDLEKFVTDLENTPSDTQARKESEQKAKKAGAKRIYHDKGWSIYKILTYEACVLYGKHTQWCITGVHGENGLARFNEYKEKGVKDYYFLIPDGRGAKWCYADYGEDAPDGTAIFFDAEDEGYGRNQLYIVAETIPVHVLEHLPDLSEMLDKYKKDTEIIKSIKKTKTLVYTEEMTKSDGLRERIVATTGVCKIVIANDVTVIPRFAFMDLAPDEIVFEEGSRLTAIDEYAFVESCYVTSITFPASLEEINTGAFAGCVKLKSVTFPEDSKLKVLGNHAFANCMELSEAHLPPSVRKIGDYAFSGCSELKSIHIGPNIDKVGEGAFDDSGVMSVEVDKRYNVTTMGTNNHCKLPQGAVIDWLEDDTTHTHQVI